MSHSTVALIIGGSSGMGLASAKKLVQQGIDTIILGSNTEKLAEAKTALGLNARTETLQANLYNRDDIERVIKQIEDEQRHIKYLVNAAGYFNPKPFLEHSVKDYDTYLDLNKATFFISQAVAKNMAANRGGSIVHLSLIHI